jgi:hypothetical protein
MFTSSLLKTVPQQLKPGIKNKPAIAALKIMREYWCRPCGTRALSPNFSRHLRAGLSHFAASRLVLDGSCSTALSEMEFTRGSEARRHPEQHRSQFFSTR